MPIQQVRKRYRVIIRDKKSGQVLTDAEQTSTYGVFIRGLTPTLLGVPQSYVVTVEYVGDYQFKSPYAKRLAAQQRNEELRKKHEVERQAKALVLRRIRIMNQIELAFVKNGKDAVHFVTCDKCEALATVLGLTHENPGATVIDPEQITGAMCANHDSKWSWPFKSTAVIECAILEFFYDGIKQIYVNRAATA
jgi:hypothetical protein